jgi:hypothetical protein
MTSADFDKLQDLIEAAEAEFRAWAPTEAIRDAGDYYFDSIYGNGITFRIDYTVMGNSETHFELMPRSAFLPAAVADGPRGRPSSLAAS